MRPLATSLGAVPFLTACAMLDGPLALDEIGLAPGAVLASERETLESAHSRGLRMDMAELSAVSDLHCSRFPWGANTPNCRYLLGYRRPDGTRGAVKRRNRTFARDEAGHWESVIVVRGD